MAVIAVLLGTAIAEPILSKEQVTKLRDVILKVESERYRNSFGGEPSFNEKERSWVYLGGVEIDGPTYHFEIREKDGYYRLGWISPRGSSGAASERFRMSPTIKRQIGKLLAEFKQEKKP